MQPLSTYQVDFPSFSNFDSNLENLITFTSEIVPIADHLTISIDACELVLQFSFSLNCPTHLKVDNKYLTEWVRKQLKFVEPSADSFRFNGDSLVVSESEQSYDLNGRQLSVTYTTSLSTPFCYSISFSMNGEGFYLPLVPYASYSDSLKADSEVASINAQELFNSPYSDTSQRFSYSLPPLSLQDSPAMPTDCSATSPEMNFAPSSSHKKRRYECNHHSELQEYEKLKQTIEDKSLELSNMQSKFSKIEESNLTLRKTNGSYAANIKVLSADIERVKQAYRSLQEKARKEREDLLLNFRKIWDENVELVRRNAELTKNPQDSEIAAINKTLRAENDRFRGLNKSLVHSLNKLLNEKDALLNEKAELNRKLMEYRLNQPNE